MMDPAIVEAALAAIYDLVQVPIGSWQAKKDQIIAQASDDQLAAVREFAAWFDDSTTVE